MASETEEEAVRNFRKLSVEQQEWLLTKSPIDWAGEMAELCGRLEARTEQRSTAVAEREKLREVLTRVLLSPMSLSINKEARELIGLEPPDGWTD